MNSSVDGQPGAGALKPVGKGHLQFGGKAFDLGQGVGQPPFGQGEFGP